MKRALITGITGQDGSYLGELLLRKNYEVYGFLRRSSNDPFFRIPADVKKKIQPIYGCLRDLAAIQRAVQISQPDEIYNLAAQSDVGLSFQIPVETKEINYLGLGRLIDAVMEFKPDAKIYQASTSEMFGDTLPPQDENSSFRPVSPYAKAKTRAHEDFVAGYREKHGLFICSGILFNHESPRRGKHFVTRKITHSLAKVKLGLQDHLELGNLQAKRDWGFAGDYVEAMWMILQQNTPEDFVIATGSSHTVEEFVWQASIFLGIPIDWCGEGLDRVGYYKNKKIVSVNPEFFRPNEVNHLLGNPTKAFDKLGWRPKVQLTELIKMMVNSDLELVRKNML